MPERLPVYASDVGTWGTVLNGYLNVGHNADGTTKTHFIDARNYGVVGDGTTNNDSAFAAIKSAANTGSGGYKTVILPDGIFRLNTAFDFGQNTTWIGQGIRPGSQGGTEIRNYATTGTDYFVAGVAGSDWSSSSIKGMRLAGYGSLTGFTLKIYNPTNASYIEDMLVAAGSGGAGGISISNAGGGGSGNPGPNFFSMHRVWGLGGLHPVEILGGAQVMDWVCGGAEPDSTSTCGLYVGGGEGQGFSLTIAGVKVEGNGFDITGFHVTGISPVTFIGCDAQNNTLSAGNTAAGFVYSSPGQEQCQVTCINCVVKGKALAFSAPGLGVSVGATNTSQTSFSYQSLRNMYYGPWRVFDDPTGKALNITNDCYLSWGGGDTTVKRASAGKVNVGSLAVGNSAAATESIGKAVVRKIQVFDASGASLGYIPVYSSIT